MLANAAPPPDQKEFRGELAGCMILYIGLTSA